jgi:surfactin synthase thioesterase subunit
MIVALIPGFSRMAAELAHWSDLLPAEVRYFDLPGHQQEPAMANPTLSSIAERYMARLPADALVVGESLGGLIALEMAAHGYRAVAFDPPLRPSDLWTLRLVLPHIMQRHASISWMPGFVESLLGIKTTGEAVERDYWSMIDAVSRPVDIIASSFSPDAFKSPALTIENTPSALTSEDIERLRQHPNVTLRVIDGPHTLLSQNVEACREALLEIIAQG